MKSSKIYFSFSVRIAFGLVFVALLSIISVRLAGEAFARRADSVTPSADSTAVAREISAFDEWLEDWRRARFAGGGELVKTGERLAAERAEAYKHLIRTNPAKALRLAVGDDLRKNLPETVARFVEQRIGARGVYNVLAIDGEDESEHRIEREFVVGPTRYEAFVYGRKMSMASKNDIALRGVVLDGLMAVEENSVRKIEGDAAGKNRIAAEVGDDMVYFNDEKEYERYVNELIRWETEIGPERSSASPWTEGAKTLLLIRVDFPDRPGVPYDRFGQPITESMAQNLLDGAVNQFYINNSYAKTSLRATVTPVVRMPQPQTAYPRENLYALITDARNGARALGYDTDNYNLDMAVYSTTDLHAFSGISPIANKGALINGNFTFKVVTHELGHAYGLMHANLWRSFDETPIGNGGNVEYGNDFDMMGRGAQMESHYNSSYKRNLDWLSDENVRTVRQNGVYRVYAHDTSQITPNVRALKIRSNDGLDYWIEFRQLLTGYPNLMNGALVHWEYPIDGWRQTRLLDMNPLTTSLADSALVVGQSFNDQANGIKMTVLGKGGTVPESLDIKIEFNNSLLNGAPFDFDGDARTDLSIFRPGQGEWWYRRSSDEQSRAFQFGSASDRIAAADFTGDGLTDIAFWRPATGFWFVLRSEDNSFYSFPFGASGDVPAPGDYDGDEKADAAVFRPSTATWYVNKSTGGTLIRQFGADGDVPVAADYDGDRKHDMAIFRPAGGEWWINGSFDDATRAFQFGSAADKPVPADFTGDGKIDVAFWRPSNGHWYVLRSEDLSFYAAPFGLAGDVPVAGDYDGDGRADFAVWRPAEANWYLSRSTSGFAAFQFGASGDTPVPSRAEP